MALVIWIWFFGSIAITGFIGWIITKIQDRIDYNRAVHYYRGYYIETKKEHNFKK